MRSDNLITIMLSYDSAKNKESVDDNDAWGDSHIELDLSGPNATATATWKDNEKGHLYDGAAKVNANWSNLAAWPKTCSRAHPPWLSHRGITRSNRALWRSVARTVRPMGVE